MIATNRPAIAGTKYKSAVDGTGAAVGAGVAAGSLAWNAVDASDE